MPPISRWAVILSWAACLVGAAARTGDLIPNFGFGGSAIVDLTGDWDLGTAITVQLDGKIILAGESTVSSVKQFGMIRLNTNGSLDPSFGVEGQVSLTLAEDFVVNDIALQSDGNIIVAGSARDALTINIAMARFTSSGALDTTFGSGGLVQSRLALSSAQSSWATSVVVLPSDSIVLAGRKYRHAHGTQFVLARYDASGGADTTFGMNGVEQIPAWEANPGGLARQADGKLIVIGSEGLGGFRSTIAFRVLVDGTLDSGFGDDGEVLLDLGQGRPDRARDVVIQPSGRIVIVGDVDDGVSTKLSLIRLLPNGTLDPSFGDSGQTRVSHGDSSFIGMNLALLPDGKLAAAGSFSEGGVARAAVVRFNANGTVDTSFGDKRNC